MGALHVMAPHRVVVGPQGLNNGCHWTVLVLGVKVVAAEGSNRSLKAKGEELYLEYVPAVHRAPECAVGALNSADLHDSVCTDD